jgi:hypothetical protein
MAAMGIPVPAIHHAENQSAKENPFTPETAKERSTDQSLINTW